MHHPTRRALTTALTALAALTLAGGCATGTPTTITHGSTAATPGAASQTPTPGPPAFTIGTPLQVDTAAWSGTYTVTKVEKTTTPDSTGMQPDNGSWVLVEATVEITKDNTLVCSCDFTLIGSDKRVYQQTYASFPAHPDFQSVDVATGQRTGGWLIFDVPPAASKGAQIQLKITSLYTQDAFGYWNI